MSLDVPTEKYELFILKIRILHPNFAQKALSRKLRRNTNIADGHTFEEPKYEVWRGFIFENLNFHFLSFMVKTAMTLITLNYILLLMDRPLHSLVFLIINITSHFTEDMS